VALEPVSGPRSIDEVLGFKRAAGRPNTDRPPTLDQRLNAAGKPYRGACAARPIQKDGIQLGAHGLKAFPLSA
jgi:hypothetical protein